MKFEAAAPRRAFGQRPEYWAIMEDSDE